MIDFVALHPLPWKLGFTPGSVIFGEPPNTSIIDATGRTLANLGDVRLEFAEFLVNTVNRAHGRG